MNQFKTYEQFKAEIENKETAINKLEAEKQEYINKTYETITGIKVSDFERKSEWDVRNVINILTYSSTLNIEAQNFIKKHINVILYGSTYDGEEYLILKSKYTSNLIKKTLKTLNIWKPEYAGLNKIELTGNDLDVWTKNTGIKGWYWWS